MFNNEAKMTPCGCCHGTGSDYYYRGMTICASCSRTWHINSFQLVAITSHLVPSVGYVTKRGERPPWGDSRMLPASARGAR